MKVSPDLSGYLPPSSGGSPYFAQTPVAKLYSEGAPVLGMDYRNTLTESRPQTAIEMDNLICRRNTVEIRKGYRIWQNKLGIIGTLMSYNPPVSASVKLFGVVDNGIFDLTIRTNNGATPAKVVTFTSPIAGETRFASQTMYATTATNFLCMCVAGEGYWTFDTVGGWIHRIAGGGPGQINGTDPTQFDYVVSWKNRLWFVKKGDTSGWYLNTNAIAGNVTEFDFGPMLARGGQVQAIYTMTVDGGDGVDDYLVIVGQYGDVLIYAGTDPSNITTFRIVGRWQVGFVPTGRRFGLKYGGDLLLMTDMGLISCAALMRGDTIGGRMFESISSPIDILLSAEMSRAAGVRGWEIILHNLEDQIILTYPQTVIGRFRAFVMFTFTNAWTTISKMPMYTMTMHGGSLFSSDGVDNIYQTFFGSTDDVGYTDAPNIIPSASLQSSYQSFNTPALYKKFMMLTLIFLGPQQPTVSAAIVKEFGIATPPGTPNIPGSSSSLWGSALWNVGVWAGGAATTYIGRLGLVGTAYYAALLMSITGYGGTRFAGFSIAYEQGDSML